MEYQCAACSKTVNGDVMVFRDHMEKHIVDLIKVDHPDWVEANGICRKCMDYYRAELKGSVFKDAACVQRQRKVRKFWERIFGVFKN